ncbi:hypothetical protein [Cesiribacter sp. SM1]|uniref:hypothetical protein n=1 Tax=Cesiribacter sp. SM1 TaxID=2861196 RepID=UPI001CD29E53|nr:hypothetical protein [Cesiribacter sp. SM1]
MNKLYTIIIILAGMTVGCNSYTSSQESVVRYYEQNAPTIARIHQLSKSIDQNFQIDFQQQRDTSIMFMGGSVDFEQAENFIIDMSFKGSIQNLLDSIERQTSNWMVTIDLYDQHLKSILHQQDTKFAKNILELLSTGLSGGGGTIMKQQGVVIINDLVDDRLVEFFIHDNPDFTLSSEENVTIQSDIYKSKEMLSFETGKISDTISYRIYKK